VNEAPDLPRCERREELRARLLRAFEARLDEALAGPELPVGLASELLEAEPGECSVPTEASHAADRTSRTGPARGGAPDFDADSCADSDLYSVWAAVTALTQEVRLQGRSFKELAERVEPIARDASLLGDTAAHLERVVAVQVGHARDEARRERIELLLDLRERLARGDSAGRELLARFSEIPRPARWKAFRPRQHDARLESLQQATRALAEGCTLALSELDEALSQLGVSRIECVGKAFDPYRMQAIALEPSESQEGRVLEVQRQGYEWGETILRTAQVKVASRSAPDGTHGPCMERS